MTTTAPPCPISVLLIEDDPADARLVRELLTRNLPVPFAVQAVNRLSAGLEQAISGEFDVVLLDLTLPDSRGMESFSRLHARVPHLPIVVLTGHDDNDLALRAVQAGAQDYLIKGQADGRVLSMAIRYAIERKRAEDTLRRSELRFRALVQNISDVVVVVDAAGMIQYTSPAAQVLLGYPAGTWVGRRVLDLVHPEDLPRAQAAAAANRSQPGTAPPIELRLRHADGSWRDVEAVANNLLDDPSVGGIVQTVRDIATRKHVEAALRASEERFRALVQHGTDLITILDPDATIRYVSPALERLLGYAPREVLATNAAGLIHPDDRDRAQDMHAARLAAPTVHTAGSSRPARACLMSSACRES